MIPASTQVQMTQMPSPIMSPSFTGFSSLPPPVVTSRAAMVGEAVGAGMGCAVVGIIEGPADGLAEGLEVGLADGFPDGNEVGVGVGVSVVGSELVGVGDGARVGESGGGMSPPPSPCPAAIAAIDTMAASRNFRRVAGALAPSRCRCASMAGDKSLRLHVCIITKFRHFKVSKRQRI